MIAQKKNTNKKRTMEIYKSLKPQPIGRSHKDKRSKKDEVIKSETRKEMDQLIPRLNEADIITCRELMNEMEIKGLNSNKEAISYLSNPRRSDDFLVAFQSVFAYGFGISL